MADLQNDITRAVTASNNLILARAHGRVRARVRVSVRFVNRRGDGMRGNTLFGRLRGVSCLPGDATL